MFNPALHLRALAFLAGVAMLTSSALARADPPARVGRLGYLTGDVSFSPAGEKDWVAATINRPLTSGDRLWADARSRAEIQVGGAVVRMSADTAVSVLNLDDRIAQLQLAQGTLNVRVRRMEADQVFEVDTPNLALTLRSAGEYRIEVDSDGLATTIFVRQGAGEVQGDGTTYLVDARQAYRFYGTGLRQYEYADARPFDDFDRWSHGRDREFDNSRSARYVSPDVVGYHDLDAYGSWRDNETYGSIWIPNRVAAGWAPYRDGHWGWVAPWGWTWIDDAPWGFAVSHYGRWANLGGTWAWVPGPRRSRAYYAPALVAFVGGSNFQLTISSGSIGGVAWFPLAPREVYRPPYAASRRYVEHINHSNTVVSNTVINRTYNTTNVTKFVYANRRVPGAVVAVPTTVFEQSQPVARASVRVRRESIASAPVAVAPHVAPTERSVHGAADRRDRAPSRTFERPVVARTAPPAPHPGFAAQRQHQPHQEPTAKPGLPLDDRSRREVKPATSAPAPVINLAPAQAAPTTVRPPQTAPDARPGRDRSNAEEPRTPAAPVSSPVNANAPTPASPSAAPVPATPAATAAPLPTERGRPVQDIQREHRAQPVAAPKAVAVPEPVTAPQAASLPATPAAVAAPLPGGRSEQDLQREQRRQPVTAPQAVAATQPAPVPQAAPQTPAAPTPQAKSSDQREGFGRRDRGEQRRQPINPPTAAVTMPAGAVAPAGVAAPAPMAQPPEQRGRWERRDRSDQREIGEQRRHAIAPPQVSVPATPMAPPQAAPLAPVAPPQTAPPAPIARQPAKPEPAAKPAEHQPPVAAQKSPAAASRPAPTAESHGQRHNRAADKPRDKRDETYDQKNTREEEERKQKR